MGAGHAHHSHSHGRAEDARRLTIALVLAASYMGAEVVGGLISGSLALLADAGHMLSDAASLALALMAMRLAKRPAPARFTWGAHRAEVLAALVNATALVVIAVFVVIEALERLSDPPDVQGHVLMAIAAGGLVVNLLAMWVLHGRRDASLNMRGAWLHVATDALGSVQALVAGALIWGFGWVWADAVASVLIAVLVAWSAWSLLRETVAVLMEGAPAGIDPGEVRAALREFDGVRDVGDLHVWTITSGLVALSAHLHVDVGVSGRDLLATLRRHLHDRFGIEHVTVQLDELGCENCHLPL